MNVVDSSGWLEYFADGSNAAFFVAAIEASGELIVPSITIYEVYKRICQQRGSAPALAAAERMLMGRVVALDSGLAKEAANLSILFHLPMADSIILATSVAVDGTLWTQDEDFKQISGVMYIAKL